MGKSQLALIALVALSVSTASAQVFQDFYLTGPAGDGLRGGNEVPPSGSQATGNVVQYNNGVGIRYYYDTQVLELHFGWGHDPGGTDLESPFERATLNGPAELDGTAPDRYTLSPSYLDSSERTGYVDSQVQLSDISGTGTYTAGQQEQDLLDGKWYVNIYTTDFPQGEIRGQLTPVPEPQTWGLLAGAGLAAFAVTRRVIARRALTA